MLVIATTELQLIVLMNDMQGVIAARWLVTAACPNYLALGFGVQQLDC